MFVRYAIITKTPAGNIVETFTPEQWDAVGDMAASALSARIWAKYDATRRARQKWEERAGGALAGIGFIATFLAAGWADAGLPVAAVGIIGALGLALLTGGLYMARAFYGQEPEALLAVKESAEK